MIVRCVKNDGENGMFIEGKMYFAINQGLTIDVYDDLNRCRVISSDDMKFCVRNDYPVIQYAHFKTVEE